MEAANMYEEKLSSRWITVVFAVVSLGLLLLLVYQTMVGPIGTRPAPNWVDFGLLLLFIAAAFNFRTLTITMTHRHVRVGYPFFHHTVFWENITGCYPDPSSALRYGGCGIRTGMANGKWRLVYNVVGTPCLVLSLNKGFFRELVFSTANP